MRALCLASRAAFFSFLLSSLSCFLLVSAMSNTFGVCVGEVRSVILLRKHWLSTGSESDEDVY